MGHIHSLGSSTNNLLLLLVENTYLKIQFSWLYGFVRQDQDLPTLQWSDNQKPASLQAQLGEVSVLTITVCMALFIPLWYIQQGVFWLEKNESASKVLSAFLLKERGTKPLSQNPFAAVFIQEHSTSSMNRSGHSISYPSMYLKT